MLFAVLLMTMDYIGNGHTYEALVKSCKGSDVYGCEFFAKDDSICVRRFCVVEGVRDENHTPEVACIENDKTS